jgi:hypothetical protein
VTFSRAWLLFWLAESGLAILLALFLPGGRHSLHVAWICALIGIGGALWFRRR